MRKTDSWLTVCTTDWNVYAMLPVVDPLVGMGVGRINLIAVRRRVSY